MKNLPTQAKRADGRPRARHTTVDGTARVVSKNRHFARLFWSDDLQPSHIDSLSELTRRYGLSVSLGEIRFFDGNWYVTHPGLLRLAEQRGCSAIDVRPIYRLCDPAAARWVFKATVYKTPKSRGFVGYGDACPENVSSLIQGKAELRMAETRAVNRALRKAYSVGICSIEEIGRMPPASPAPAKTAQTTSARPVPVRPVPSGDNGQPRLRERLRQLMSQYRLDPLLVKRYATDFCGTEDLRQAPQEKLETFVNHLAEWCSSDRAGLRCKLNSYLLREEVKA